MDLSSATTIILEGKDMEGPGIFLKASVEILVKGLLHDSLVDSERIWNKNALTGKDRGTQAWTELIFSATSCMHTGCLLAWKRPLKSPKSSNMESE